jgi:four helix bundle protein
MNKSELENRTKVYAVRAIHFVSELPKSKVADVLTYQLLKSATSIGANYREANRAASRGDFSHKISIVEKEASETHYWLELLEEAQLGKPDARAWLLQEADQLIAIFTRIGKSTKLNGTTNPKSEIRNPK